MRFPSHVPSQSQLPTRFTPSRKSLGISLGFSLEEGSSGSTASSGHILADVFHLDLVTGDLDIITLCDRFGDTLLSLDLLHLGVTLGLVVGYIRYRVCEWVSSVQQWVSLRCGHTYRV